MEQIWFFGQGILVASDRDLVLISEKESQTVKRWIENSKILIKDEFVVEFTIDSLWVLNEGLELVNQQEISNLNCIDVNLKGSMLIGTKEGTVLLDNDLIYEDKSAILKVRFTKSKEILIATC